MSNQQNQPQSVEGIIEKLVEKITDYGYNDEYGYYNEWADGVRPIIQNAVNQLLAHQQSELLDKIRAMKIEEGDLANHYQLPEPLNAYQSTAVKAFNVAIDMIISSLSNNKS